MKQGNKSSDQELLILFLWTWLSLAKGKKNISTLERKEHPFPALWVHVSLSQTPRPDCQDLARSFTFYPMLPRSGHYLRYLPGHSDTVSVSIDRLDLM